MSASCSGSEGPCLPRCKFQPPPRQTTWSLLPKSAGRPLAPHHRCADADQSSVEADWRPRMRILLINVPHPSIGSRIPDDHLPPLGLLSIGGPLIDDGHEVRLLDGEFGPMLEQAITAEALTFAPDAVLFGHSGSTSGHPVITEIAQAIVRAMPNVLIVYGGVFPTYHWREVLRDEPYVTAIVRGEGEETARRLMRA